MNKTQIRIAAACGVAALAGATVTAIVLFSGGSGHAATITVGGGTSGSAETALPFASQPVTGGTKVVAKTVKAGGVQAADATDPTTVDPNTPPATDVTDPTDPPTTVAPDPDPTTTIASDPDTTTTVPADTTTTEPPETTTTVPATTTTTVPEPPYPTSVTVTCADSALDVTVSIRQPGPATTFISGPLVIEWTGGAGEPLAYPLTVGYGTATAVAPIPAGATSAEVVYDGYTGRLNMSSAASGVC